VWKPLSLLLLWLLSTLRQQRHPQQRVTQHCWQQYLMQQGLVPPVPQKLLLGEGPLGLPCAQYPTPPLPAILLLLPSLLLPVLLLLLQLRRW
jgi:hypothetical protein